MEKIKITLELSIKDIDNIYDYFNSSEHEEISNILNEILCKVKHKNNKIEQFTKKINEILI